MSFVSTEFKISDLPSPVRKYKNKKTQTNNKKTKVFREYLLTIISQTQKELTTATELVNDESQVPRMVPGTKWTLNKYLWMNESLDIYKFVTSNTLLKTFLLLLLHLFLFPGILHGNTSLGYFLHFPIRCPVGCLETIWIRWHDILNYIYFRWDNILKLHNYIIILITEVAIVIELFHILFDQMQIKESLRHPIMRHT